MLLFLLLLCILSPAPAPILALAPAPIVAFAGVAPVDGGAEGIGLKALGASASTTAGGADSKAVDASADTDVDHDDMPFCSLATVLPYFEAIEAWNLIRIDTDSYRRFTKNHPPSAVPPKIATHSKAYFPLDSCNILQLIYQVHVKIIFFYSSYIHLPQILFSSSLFHSLCTTHVGPVQLLILCSSPCA